MLETKLGKLGGPNFCPRCGSGLLDKTFDSLRHPDVARTWEDAQPKPMLAILAILMIILTAGLWLVVMGLWSMAMAPGKRSLHKRGVDAAALCIRTHCRGCGLTFYPDEIAYIQQQSAQGSVTVRPLPR